MSTDRATATVRGYAMLDTIAHSFLNEGNGAPKCAAQSETWVESLGDAPHRDLGPKSGYGGIIAQLVVDGLVNTDGEVIALTEAGFTVWNLWKHGI